MRTFNEFRERKDREGARHLRIVRRVLEEAGLTVDDFTKEDDPYVYLHSNDGRATFGGVRIYPIGDSIAYRMQNDPEAHPYGKSYHLDVENIFNDLLSENDDENKAGKAVMEAIVEEFKNFFEKTLKAQEELDGEEDEIKGRLDNPLGDYTQLNMNQYR